MTFPTNFWRLEMKFQQHERSFCPFYQHREIHNLLIFLRNHEVFIEQHRPSIIGLLVWRALNGSFSFEHNEHFFRLFQIIEGAAPFPTLQNLLSNFFAHDWAAFLLDHSLD